MLTLSEIMVISVLALAMSLALTSFIQTSDSRLRGSNTHRIGDLESLTLPVWTADSSGNLVWANQAFRSIWGNVPVLPPVGRACVTHDGRKLHFDVVSSGRMMLAIPVDALVRAEHDLREMVQTMAKTFAQLPTGLAVFDRHRRLQSFNPALCELTQLSPEYLSRRPSMIAMLDRMRDANMVPEPKNWKAWRREITGMGRAAAHRHLEETWTLPGGQTYRVTGRPHPDGGLALMIDDISSEVIRSQRYRAELDVCQAVIDYLDDGIVVFASTGKLIMSNSAYTSLWGHQPGENLAMTGIRQMTNRWRARSAPSAHWSELEAYVTILGDRLPWAAEVRLLDGRFVDCRLYPLPSGATLVKFREVRGNHALVAVV